MRRRGHRGKGISSGRPSEGLTPPDFSYQQSETSRQQDAHMMDEDEDSEGPYINEDRRRTAALPPQSPYTSTNLPPNYPPVSAGFAQPPPMGYTGPIYPGSSMPPTSGPYTSGPVYSNNILSYSQASRTGIPEQNYTFGGSEYGGSSDPYGRQPPGYAPIPRENRSESSRMYTGNARMEARERTDYSRADPRPDPRYPYANPSGTDIPMEGMDAPYPYGNVQPTINNRGAYPATSRGGPPGYERDSPGVRGDLYRQDPSRDKHEFRRRN